MLAALTWTLVAVWGIVVQLGYLRDTRADLHFWTDADGNDAVRAVAKQHVLTAGIRTAVVIAYALVGVGSFTVSNAAPVDTWTAVFSALAALVLIGGEVALISLTWLDRRLRRTLASQGGTSLPARRRWLF